MRILPPERVLGEPDKHAAAQVILDQLRELASAVTSTSSLVTPMGDEIYYRYQQSMIDEAITTLATLFQRAPSAAKPSAGSVAGLNPNSLIQMAPGKFRPPDIANFRG